MIKAGETRPLLLYSADFFDCVRKVSRIYRLCVTAKIGDAMRVFCLCLLLSLLGGPVSAGEAERSPVVLTVAAAASLRQSFENELIPLFQSQYPWITVEGTYDGSGKLQTQIENGLDADVFMSAAMTQMNSLTEKKFIDAASVTPLLENRIVLVCPSASASGITSFPDVLKADIIAIGDPDSVPAGQYAREAFTALGVWEEVKAKASLATNVTEVLAWVAGGSADVGVVYATDAALTSKVSVVGEAPEGSLREKVMYPVGMLSGSRHKDEAGLFIEFLISDKALAVFEKYGFSSGRGAGKTDPGRM